MFIYLVIYFKFPAPVPKIPSLQANSIQYVKAESKNSQNSSESN